MSSKIPPKVTKDPNFGDRESHESYGIVGVSRVSHSGDATLFGSSIKHHHTFQITVRRAESVRSLHNTHYRGNETIVEFEMSPSQFIDMVTTMNIGDGVPCTLLRVGGKRMDECPHVDQREIFHNEFRDRVQKTMERFQEIIQSVSAAISAKTVTKATLKEIQSQLFRMSADLGSNLDFVHSQFGEAMDKTVNECKAEVATFVESIIASSGLDHLLEQAKSELPRLEDRSSESE